MLLSDVISGLQLLTRAEMRSRSSESSSDDRFGLVRVLTHWRWDLRMFRSSPRVTARTSSDSSCRPCSRDWTFSAAVFWSSVSPALRARRLLEHCGIGGKFRSFSGKSRRHCSTRTSRALNAASPTGPSVWRLSRRATATWLEELPSCNGAYDASARIRYVIPISPCTRTSTGAVRRMDADSRTRNWGRCLPTNFPVTRIRKMTPRMIFSLESLADWSSNLSPRCLSSLVTLSPSASSAGTSPGRTDEVSVRSFPISTAMLFDVKSTSPSGSEP